MKIRYFLIILLACIFIFCAKFISWAQDAVPETIIKAEVDKLKASTDDAINYKLTIVSYKQNIPPPSLPKFEGFNLISQMQSSTVSYARGKIKTSKVYIFFLSAKNPGKIKIEPAELKIKDEIYKSQGFEIEVTQGKGQLSPNPKQKQLPRRVPPQPGEPQVTL